MLFEPGTIVLGFGFSSIDTNSWAMILRTPTDQDARTLTASLDIAVWTGAYGRVDNWSESVVGQFSVLRKIAEHAILSLDGPDLD